jgi:Kef-type K+ transport system membrane component KefB
MAGRGHRGALLGYAGLLTAAGAVILGAIIIGSGLDPARGVAGTYRVDPPSTCLGPDIALQQSGRFVNVAPVEESQDGSSDLGGSLELRDDRLSGSVSCTDGSTESFSAAVTGEIVRDEEGHVVEGPGLEEGSIGGEAFRAAFVPQGEDVGVSFEEREPENTLGRLMLAIAVVLIAGRLVGAAVARVGQPRVMGEVLAGILLGPTLLASVIPEVQGYIFPADIVHLLRGAADIGLVFYMFLVGLELDPKLLEGRVEQAAFISHAGIAVPMALGMAAAVPLYAVVGPSDAFAPFALFMGVAMAITAFPVLARILIERRMLKGSVGSMAIASAAIDDVSAWVLLALATAVATAATAGMEGSVLPTLVRVVGLTAVFCAVMGLVIRRLIARVSVAYDEAGHLPAGWTAAIFLGVLLSAYVAAQIPIAGIFGAFVMGLIMPRHAGLTHDVTRRVEDFVVTLLLPLFFVVAGLSVRLDLLNTPLLWGITVALLFVAVVSKWAGAMTAARYVGMPAREAAALGALMNTRGLTELIVLSIGLSFGVITPAIYTMLVIMALVTTFMTGPALRLIDRDGTLSMPAEAEVSRAESTAPTRAVARPERTIIVAALDERNLDPLLTLAVPLARSEPDRELLMIRPLEPSRIVTGISPLERDLEEAEESLRARRSALREQGVWTRSAVFTSADVGEDLLRLASEQQVDLVLLDGRRPLLGEGPPGGAVGLVLERAEPDVAVLIEREGELDLGPDRPVTVAFGGGPHDWTALELGAWIASMTDAPLVLLGNEADLQEGRRDASHLLANASLVVQNLVGIPAIPRLVPPGREGIVEAARGAGLLVLGLSERWRAEGLGEVRSAIARTAPAPTVFVRRGSRPGALAPPEDATRYTWSRTGRPAPDATGP